MVAPLAPCLPQTWCGRWAMLGFASSMAGEFITGRGTLGQLGVPASPELLIVLSVFFGGLTVAATADTARRLLTKQMTRADVDRYKNFLALNKDDDWKAEAQAMKKVREGCGGERACT